MASTDNENVVCQTGGVNCYCKWGFYSPSGDPTKNKDCTARLTKVSIGVEFPLNPSGGDVKFKWSNGAALVQIGNEQGDWYDLMTYEIGGYKIKDGVVLSLKDAEISSVRGSTSMTVSGDPTFVQSPIDGTHIWVKGLIYTWTWQAAEIEVSPNPLVQDLMKMTKDKGKTWWLKELSDDNFVMTDLTKYPTWGGWGPFGSCDEGSCTHTKTKECVNTNHPHSQFSCIDPNDPDDPTSETQTCTSNTCRKYTG